MKEVLAKLQIDEHYYGEYGQKWLSNSNIYTLLNEPHLFGKPKDTLEAPQVVLTPSSSLNFLTRVKT